MRLIFLVVVSAYLVWRLILLWRGKGHQVVTWTTLAVVVATGALEYRWLAREHQFSEVTRTLVGDEEMRVHCQRTLGFLVDISGHMGYVPYPPDRRPVDAYLRNDTCRSLGDFVADPKDPSEEEVMAVHVLTHEAMHLAGARDEAVAECMAMQRNAQTATLLGANEDAAWALARRYWTDIHPRMASEYRTAQCAPGGALDEHLPHSPWSESEDD